MKKNNAARQRKKSKKNIKIIFSKNVETDKVNSSTYEIEVITSISSIAQFAIELTSVFVTNRQIFFVKRCKICREFDHNNRNCSKKSKTSR